MKNTIQYKGYIGSVEFSEEDSIFFGKVQGIRSLISYEGDDASSLVNDFHQAIDDYLEVCEENKVTPEKPYKGSTNLRFHHDIYQRMALYTMNHGQSINSFVEEAVKEKLKRLNA